MIRKVLALALCLFVVQSVIAGGSAALLPSSSQASGRVEGSVSDPNGAKVVNARVSLRNAAGIAAYESKTDSEGRFSFSNVAEGRYELVVEADGFSQPDKVSVEVKAGAAQTVSVRLAVAAVSERIDVAATNPIYTKLRAAKLSGESATLKNVVLKRDAASINFKEGQIYFIAPVEGKVTGAVFIGDGEFQMTPPLELEKKHISILTGTPSITEQFNKMVMRFTDATYDELKKQATTGSGSVGSDAQSTLDENRSMLRKGGIRYNVDARILVDLTMPAPDGLFNAFFSGKRFGNWVFAIDPLGVSQYAPEEVVLINTTEENFGVWGAFHLDQHYRSPAVVDEDHRLIDILHHNIETAIKGKRLEAIVQTRMKALKEGARVLPFDLIPVLRVSKVTDDRGQELNFIQEKKNEDADFYVILPEGLKKGQEFTLKFEYGGEDVVVDSGGGNYALHPAARGNWYPNGSNAAFGDRATFDITLKSQKGLLMVATGQPVGETEEGEFTVTRWKSDVPLQVAGFNYGKFKKTAVKNEKTNYMFESYANKELPQSLRSLQQAVEAAEREGRQTDSTLGSLNTVSLMDKARIEAEVAVALYTEFFGALPYGRIAMTQQPYVNFGQAWPMLVYMPWIAYLDSTHRNQLRSLIGLGVRENFLKIVGPHEVAHQWWGHIIGWKSYRDQWMSEGFSHLSASIFAQYVYKNDLMTNFWKEQRELMLGKNRQGKRPVDIGSVYMGYRLNTPKTGQIAQSMIYPKGGFILHMLRMMMWDAKTTDQRFSAMMKDFVKTHYNQDVSTQDFQRIVQKHMTKEMDLEGNGKIDWYFKQWVMGSSIPDYKLTYRLDPAEGGKVMLVGKITQSNVEDSFMMRVPIYIDVDGKVRRLGAINVYGNSTTDEFRVPLEKKPKRVMIAYFEDVLCTTENR